MGRPPKAAEAAAPRASLIDRLVTFPTSDPRVASGKGSLELAFATAPSASALAFAAPHPMRLLHPGRLPFESALALASLIVAWDAACRARPGPQHTDVMIPTFRPVM